jgi:putative hemin transport protein
MLQPAQKTEETNVAFGVASLEEVKKLAAQNNQAENKVLEKFTALKAEKPETRPYDATKELGITEAELVAARIDGETIFRLEGTQIENIMQRLKNLGEVTCITRNDSCVHERKGVYENLDFFNSGPGNRVRMGLAVNPDIDTRLFMNNWGKVYAVTENARGQARKSVQFYGNDGLALHKIYLNNNSNEAEYNKLITEFASHNQSFNEVITPKAPMGRPPQADETADVAGFEAELANLKDTHDYFILLHKYNLTREQGFRLVSEKYAYKVANDSARKVLELAAASGLEIMVFVGNYGCIQIHTGGVQKLADMQGYFNVLDPKFNLHLNESKIASSYVSFKPTEDGVVTSLEILDEKGETIATFFGKRKPGIPELAEWRELVAKLEKISK